MQRISDGLAVPRQMIDTFTGKTSNVLALVQCVLTYTPKSMDDILVPDGFESTLFGRRVYKKDTLTGNILSLLVKKYKYSKADSPVVVGNSGGAGADPHSHNLTYTVTEVDLGSAGNEAQGPIVVEYKVA